MANRLARDGQERIPLGGVYQKCTLPCMGVSFEVMNAVGEGKSGLTVLLFVSAIPVRQRSSALTSDERVLCTVEYLIQGSVCAWDLPCKGHDVVSFIITTPGKEQTPLGMISTRAADSFEGYAKQVFTDANHFMADFPNGCGLRSKYDCNSCARIALGGLYQSDLYTKHTVLVLVGVCSLAPSC